MRRLLLVCLVVVCAAATGCGGARERGKNNDYDRPALNKDEK